MQKKKMLLITGLLVVMFCITLPQQTMATTETLEPTADTYIDSNNPTSNYGGSNWLDVSYYAWDSEFFEDWEERIYLKFDLSTIPSDAAINSAKLRLYTLLAMETTTIGSYFCSDNNWSELGVNWDTAPSTSGSATATTTVAQDSEWYVWDVKSIAEKGNTISIVLKLEESEKEKSPSVSFYSKEGAYEPELVVDYSVGGGGGACLGTILIAIIPLAVAFGLKRKVGLFRKN